VVRSSYFKLSHLSLITFTKDIADGAIMLLIDTYCKVLLQGGGYLTQKHQLHLPRVELFLQSLSAKEPLYFEQRSIDEGEQNYATSYYNDYYYLVSLYQLCGPI
jgi:5'-3' exonuclease